MGRVCGTGAGVRALVHVLPRGIVADVGGCAGGLVAQQGCDW